MTETARQVDAQLTFLLAFSAAALAALVTTLVVFVVRYRRSRHPEPADIRGNPILEALWVLVPTIIVLVIFYVGLTGYLFLRRAPAGALEIRVTAFKYGWEFEYKNGRKDRRLVVPEDIPVRLTLTSRDVIHSFFIPDFRIKQDAVPGLKTSMWFEAADPGEHLAVCAEYCGLAHSDMSATVVVLPRPDYDAWYAAGSPGS